MSGTVTQEMRKSRLQRETNGSSGPNYWIRLYSDTAITDTTLIASLNECDFLTYPAGGYSGTYVNNAQIDSDGTAFRITGDLLVTSGGGSGPGSVVGSYVIFADAATTLPLHWEAFPTPIDLSLAGSNFPLLPIAVRNKQLP
jgi:hypothetical protein